MIIVIDYGAGNIKSVVNVLHYLGYEPKVSSDYSDLNKSSVIILPGVGAFPDCMNNLKKRKMIDALNENILIKKKPYFGICMGLQLLGTKGFENQLTNGLGWMNGQVVKIEKKDSIRIPHMGWNTIEINNKSGLFTDFQEKPSFYFVHSYYLKLNNDQFVTSTCDHGGRLTASVEKENIFAVQFHPEKSQNNGLRLLNNYFKLIDYK